MKHLTKEQWVLLLMTDINKFNEERGKTNWCKGLTSKIQTFSEQTSVALIFAEQTSVE